MSTQSQTKILKTLKVKIKLDSINRLRLDTLSNEHRQLYNHLMEFVKTSKTSDFKDIGDIKTKKLKDNKTANKGLNKSTQNEGTLSRFKGFLIYKAKESGLAVSLINEAYTSQENCLTGVRNLSSDLKHRTVQVSYKLEIDRDLNSAINISKRIKPAWFRQFDEEALKNINASYQEMYFDLKLGRLIRK